MKSLYKILLCLIMVIMLAGCGDSAKMAVDEYFAKYNSLHEDVISDMASIVDNENLSDENKSVYESIFKKQYTDLTYKIVEEQYDGDEATVKVQVTVYDLYKVQNDATQYLADNPDEFVDETGMYNPEMFIKYKLDQMKNTMDTTQYTIDFYVVKTSSGWQVSSLSKTDLEKIHGIYNYES